MTTNDQPAPAFPHIQKQNVLTAAERSAFIKRAVGVMYVDADGRMMFDKLPGSEPAPAAGSDTPRTDMAYKTHGFGDASIVPADFARQLERELADAVAANAALREEVARLDRDKPWLTEANAMANDLRTQLATAQTFADNQAEEIERLQTELEANAWKISPAMAQAQIDQLNAKVAELEQDKARLDWLCAQAYWPHEVPNDGISLAIAENAITHGGITLNARQDEATIRAAIDAARSASKEGQP
jgi:hypothetical protein